MHPKPPRRTRLTTTDLAVAVGGVELLRGLSISVDGSSSLSLAGPSGCGKTSLLRTIAGLIDPVRGEVRLEGRTPSEMGWPAFRRNVVLVHQKPTLLDLSVRANLERPFHYRLASAPFPLEKASRLLHRLGVGSHRLEEGARDLSVGEQQRVCLIRSLLLQPQVILLDEPTSALDVEAVNRVEEVVREEMSRSGMAAIVATHDPGQARRWSDQHLDLAAMRCQHQEID